MSELLTDAKQILKNLVTYLPTPKAWRVRTEGQRAIAEGPGIKLVLHVLPPEAPKRVMANVMCFVGMPHALTLAAADDDPVSLVTFLQAACTVLGQDGLFAPLREAGGRIGAETVAEMRMARLAPKVEA